MNTYDNRIGLINRGNTCYLNTSIQCLFNLIDIKDYFSSNEYIVDLKNRYEEMNDKKLNEITLSKEFGKLIKIMLNNKSNYVEPKTLHTLIQKYDNRFIGFEQQDSQEALALILDYLDEGLKYNVDISYSGVVENNIDQLVVESSQNLIDNMKGKYSIITHLFFGQFINKIVSLENNNKDAIISKNFEIFNMLNISIYGKTLYDSLAKYFEKETLESKYLDEKTNQYIDTYKQIKLMIVPKYLIIVLKRYKNNNNGNVYKSNNSISFPFDNLDISSYCEGYDMFECKLNLISIGCHEGGLNSGHYYAVCRNKNKKWYKYDDETVSEYLIELNKHNLFRNGYILIYEKIE